MMNLNDVRDFDAVLKNRVNLYRERLRDWLAPHRLTLGEARVHKVLIPMVGVYTPGWQALPAVSWEFVEVVTEQGLVGTGEWSIGLDTKARDCLDQLKNDPGRNLLAPGLEEPLYMAWWDLVGQVLGKPLQELWGQLFEVGFTPPRHVPMAAYTWQRFPDMNGRGEITFDTWPQFAAGLALKGFPSIKVSMTAYQPEDHIELIQRIREAVGP